MKPKVDLYIESRDAKKIAIMVESESNKRFITP